MREPCTGRLVVVGGWGVRCEMLSGLFDRWQGEVDLVSLDDEIMSVCDSVDALAGELLGQYPSPAVWLGWSLGSQVAMAAAARQTGTVTHVITAGGFPRFTAAPDWPSGMPQRDFEAFARGIERDPARYWLHFLLLMINGDANERQARKQLKQWLEQGAPVSAENLVKGLAWLRNEDQRQLWRNSETPALHLLGDRDAVVRPWPSQETGVGQTVEVVRGMAHWPAGPGAEHCQQRMADYLGAPGRGLQGVNA